jgi:ribokinase
MARIAVVGSLNMDLVARVTSLPTIGETVGEARFMAVPGGKGANQAVAAARLGAEVVLIGRVGRDGYGVELRRGLAADGVDATHVVDDPHLPTGVAMIAVDARGQNTIIVAPGANANLSPADVMAASASIEAADVLLLQFETPIDASIEAARLARAAGVRVILNPAPARDVPPALASLVDWIVPNETEAALVLRHPMVSISDDPGDAAIALRLETGVANILITMGEHGALLATPEQVIALPAPPVAVVDTVAAGDAFIAGFAVALSEGLDLEAALRMGLAAGSLACTIAGAQPALPTRAALEALLQR